MKATETLMQEHRVIEGVLDTLQTAAQSAGEGNPATRGPSALRPSFFIDAADFIRGFADGCHHHKEEGVLFKMMADNGFPTQGGPIGMMLQEHELGRQYTRAMRSAAEKWAQGDESARQQAVENAQGYVALLRQHIMKEDNILFPMADRAIPVSEHDAVFSGFEQVEHEETGEGVHEKYLALAERLHDEVFGLLESS
jgi:hemerythrin-like domain-containing protein